MTIITMMMMMMMMKTRDVLLGVLKPARHAILPALLAATAAALSACKPAAADMQDLKNWLATARRQQIAALGLIAPSSTQTTPMQPAAKTSAIQIIATRDPFAPLAIKIVTPSLSAPGAQPASATQATLHLLGTVHNGSTAYALIKAGRQVLCIASNASLPSYSTKVTNITEHAVALERLLPDGSRQQSILRQGD
jgi:Tfp pilus assembly protein PilP